MNLKNLSDKLKPPETFEFKNEVEIDKIVFQKVKK